MNDKAASWSGGSTTATSVVVTCPDMHKCRNGGQCKEDPAKEGSYVSASFLSQLVSARYAVVPTKRTGEAFFEGQGNAMHAKFNVDIPWQTEHTVIAVLAALPSHSFAHPPE